VRAFGELHGTPIHIPATQYDVEHWLVIVGGSDAVSAWLLTPGDVDHEITQIKGWPAGGVRVVASAVTARPSAWPGNYNASFVFLIVESIGGPDEPKGLRAIIPLEINAARYVNRVVLEREELVAFSGANDTAELARRVAAAGAAFDDSYAAGKLATGTTLADLKAALGTKGNLTAFVPPGGVSVYAVDGGPEMFVRSLGQAHDRAELARFLGDKITLDCEGSGECPVGNGWLLLGVEHEHLVVRTALVDAIQPAPTPARRVVKAATTISKTTERTMSELGHPGATVLAEAPWSATGTVGVARAGNSLFVVVRDGGIAEVSPLSATNVSSAEQIRFLDFDGDGRTDVAVQDGSSKRFFFDSATGSADFIAELAATDAVDLDHAVERVLTIPWRTVDDENAACLLLRRIRDGKSLHAQSAPGAEVFALSQTGYALANPTASYELLRDKPAASMIADQLSACGGVCDPHRPLCTFETGNLGQPPDYVLYTWVDGKLKLDRAVVRR
jgi:hypothetical protein